MQIKELYKKSLTSKLLNFLFKDNLDIKFADTFTGKILSIISVPLVAELTLVFSIFLLWYEGLFVKYFPIIGNSYFLPTILLAGFLFSNKKELRLKKYHLYYLIFIFISAFSAVFAVNFIEKDILFVGIFIFLQFGMFLLIAESVRRKLLVLKGLIIMGLPLTLVAFYQVVTRVETRLWFSFYESGTTRAFAFFGSPNVLGLVMAILAIVSICLFLESNKKMYLIPTVLYLVTVILTFSREAWLAFLGGALVISFFVFKKMFWGLLLAAPVLGGVIPQIRERFMTIFNPNYIFDSYLDGRIWAAINANFLFKQKPFLGWGPGSYGGQTALTNSSPVYLEGIQNGYTALYFTDNQYLEILVQTGFLGTMAFGMFLISFLAQRAVRITKNNYMALSGPGVFVAFLVGGMFANVLEFGAVSALTAVVMGATSEKDN